MNSYGNLRDFLMTLTMSLTVTQSTSVGCKLAYWKTNGVKLNTQYFHLKYESTVGTICLYISKT